MKLAIMQPYFFPYIGYFQLIDSVDLFIIYNDVTFIKQGWISRNRILVNQEPRYFTIPLNKASSNRQIKDIYIHSNLFEKWKIKFLKTIEQSYSKAPHFETVYPLIKQVLNNPTLELDKFCASGLMAIMDYLGIETKISFASNSTYNSNSKGAERVISICTNENANTYVNAIGGKELYNPLQFKNEGIDLKFIEPLKITYKQHQDRFYPNLSIIDVCMFNSKEALNSLLKKYKLT